MKVEKIQIEYLVSLKPKANFVRTLKLLMFLDETYSMWAHQSTTSTKCRLGSNSGYQNGQKIPSYCLCEVGYLGAFDYHQPNTSKLGVLGKTSSSR